MTYRIMCDLDDVVFDFVPYFLNFTNQLYGYADRREDVTDWDWWECPGISLTFDQFLYGIDLFTKYELWSRIPLFPDALPNILDLVNKGAEILFVTDRPEGTEIQTLVSLATNKIPISRKDLIFCKAKEKANLCIEREINIVVEDKFETVIECARQRIPTVLKLSSHNARRWEMMKLSPVNNTFPQIYHDVRKDMHISEEWLAYITTVKNFREFANIVRDKLCADTQGDSE